jgi:hypothetical protein
MLRLFRILVGSAALAAILGVAPATALAQDAESVANMAPTFIAKLQLGLGGAASAGGVEDDMRPSFGGALWYDHPVHTYFALGGLVSFARWNTEAGDTVGHEGNSLIDISLVPRVRYPLEKIVEIYLALPVGLAIDAASGDPYGTDNDTGLGFNFSALLGGQLAVSEGFGIMGEMGYGIHSVSHSFGGANVDIDLRQFQVTAGIYGRL